LQRFTRLNQQSECCTVDSEWQAIEFAQQTQHNEFANNAVPFLLGYGWQFGRTLELPAKRNHLCFLTF
jgi:hypothetical protein